MWPKCVEDEPELNFIDMIFECGKKEKFNQTHGGREEKQGTIEDRQEVFQGIKKYKRDNRLRVVGDKKVK